MSGPLKAVILASEVHLVCTAHAFSTEVEEIMGLLIGWCNREKGICYVSHCVQLKRIDKRKDRVEISEEQLAYTFTMVEELNTERKERRRRGRDWGEAERLAGENQTDLFHSLKVSSESEELRVVGWYHSHPHITVFPSEVDIRTQNQYQQNLDNLWVGLIFGVFHADSKNFSTTPYIAFQSTTEQPDLVNGIFGQDLTEDELPPLGGDRSPTTIALANSTYAGNGLKHRLIPVFSLPQKVNSGAVGRWATVGLRDLSKLVLEESQEALERKVISSAMKKGSIWDLHNAAVYSQAVCKVMGRLTKPLIQTFQIKKFFVCDPL